MSQTKTIGRPAAAKREVVLPLAEPAVHCAAYFKDVFAVKHDDLKLIWRVPFRKIIEAIQTIGGIAKLSGFSRKTVYRKKIPLGSISAFAFVIDTWRGTGRPLVSHTDPMHHLNFGKRLKSHFVFPKGVPEVMEVCRAWFENGSRTVSTTLMKPPTETEPASPLIAMMDAKSQRRRRNWKRKLKVTESPNPEWMTDDYAKDLQRKERLGQTYFYRPKHRVTVKMLCSNFGVPRREFYRWIDSLMPTERALLKAAMSGKLFKIQGSTGDDSWLRDETVNFPSDRELDDSLGWKEPT